MIVLLWYLLCGQIVLYIPYGGQTLVKAYIQSPSQEWVSVFDATSRDVDVSTSEATPMQHVSFAVNPCRVTFASDTIRLVFDTDLTKQWLGVSTACEATLSPSFCVCFLLVLTLSLMHCVRCVSVRRGEVDWLLGHASGSCAQRWKWPCG